MSGIRGLRLNLINRKAYHRKYNPLTVHFFRYDILNVRLLYLFRPRPLSPQPPTPGSQFLLAFIKFLQQSMLPDLLFHYFCEDSCFEPLMREGVKD